MLASHRMPSLIMILSFVLLASCVTSKNQARQEEERASSERVLHGPPADADQPIEVPRGGPILEEYTTPPEVDGASGALSGEERASAEIGRAELDRLLSQGPGWGLAQVEVNPVRADGSFLGFEIIRFSSAARAHISPPLEVGDVITHLNGVKLVRPDDYSQAWQMGRSLPSVRIDFLREGSPGHAIWVVRD